MEKRQATDNGLEASAIGLGCMGMSEFYGPADDAKSIPVIHRALELGVIFLDTADMYGSGENEKLLARARGSPRPGRGVHQVRHPTRGRRLLHGDQRSARVCEAGL